MNRIKCLAAFAIILISISSEAQQDPHYSHFNFSPQSFNPSTIALKTGSFCFNALSHRQWQGFDDQTAIERKDGAGTRGVLVKNVAPTTHSFNAFGPMMLNGQWSGVWFMGAHLSSDKVNAFKTNRMHLSIAHKFTPAYRSYILVGAKIGVQQIALDRPQFIARQIPDPFLPPSGLFISDKNLDASVGITYLRQASRRLGQTQIGFGLEHINRASYDLQSFDVDQVIHANLMGSTSLRLGPGAVLKPAFLVKYGRVLQLDVSSNLIIQQDYRVGLGYRQWQNSDALSLLLGYTLPSGIHIGYSYDFTLSKIRKVSHGTHELFMSYCIPLENYWHRNIRWL